MSEAIRWETASGPYQSPRSAQVADFGIHRLYVRRAAKGSRQFAGAIDGEPVGVWGNIECAQRRVEEIVRQRLLNAHPIPRQEPVEKRQRRIALRKALQIALRGLPEGDVVEVLAGGWLTLNRLDLLKEQMPSACSHAWYDKEIRERHLAVGVLPVSSSIARDAPDSELAGTRNVMYPGRVYVCSRCKLALRVPGKPRGSRFDQVTVLKQRAL